MKAVILLFWMGLIFFLSAQPAADSSATSNSTALLLYRLLCLLGWDGISESVFLETYMHPIRKMAHFLEFMILGILVIMNIHEYKKKNVLLWSLVLSGIYAISDEIHQLFVPNRSCSPKDMLIDISGACLGIFLYHLIDEWKKESS